MRRAISFTSAWTSQLMRTVRSEKQSFISELKTVQWRFARHMLFTRGYVMKRNLWVKKEYTLIICYTAFFTSIKWNHKVLIRRMVTVTLQFVTESLIERSLPQWLRFSGNSLSCHWKERKYLCKYTVTARYKCTETLTFFQPFADGGNGIDLLRVLFTSPFSICKQLFW